MIPVLSHAAVVPADIAAFISALQQRGFAGDIETSYGARLAVGTDNSIYQTMPQAVVLPRHHEDVVLLTAVAQQPEFQALKFAARGGGTGTNGQALTDFIVVDLSRHMREIFEINVEERWVRVQAGVIKDQLNAFLKPFGFFFAPDLSTSNRATIGGMINTDASGQGSLVYGKTSDHVLSLRTVLVDGTELDTTPVSLTTAQQLAQQNDGIGAIYRQVIATCVGQRDAIVAKFPRLNRFLTGYDLEHAWNPATQQIDVSRLITGSEGSLGFVTEAKLSITPIAPFKCLINVKYNSFESALRNAPFLVAAEATSVETVDSKVLNLARNDIIWHQVKSHIEDVPGHDMQGLNMVEYNAEDPEDMARKVALLQQRLDDALSRGDAGIIGYQITHDEQAILQIYAMRKKAVGLLGNAKGRQKPLPFAEDTAVPPEHLADFIMEFRALLDSHGLQYGMFGHVDAGVLHVRPALDMTDPAQEQLLRSVSDDVVALTAKYGGLMWGEHGKGYRSEYGPAFFGEALFTELRKIKACFDPHNRMNPGKICTPLESDAVLVSVDGQKRGFFDRQIPVVVRDSFEHATSCNGNGLCFNYEAQSPMCPSSKVTKDRRHSPKGRAGMMREWLRLMANQGVDVLAQEQQLLSQSRGLKGTWQRWRNSRLKDNDDFSHEVKEVMDGCLACKACAGQCPIKVDVPAFRARFLQLYHSRYARPLKDFMVGSVERTAPLLAKMPRLVNALLSMSLSQRLLRDVVGYVDTPQLSVPTLAQRMEPQWQFDMARLQALSSSEQQKLVFLVQDPFTSFYEADLVHDALRLIEKLGFSPVLLPFVPNGKPQHVKGFLAEFAKTAATASAFLQQIHAFNAPMIGLDASLVLVYRDEYRKILAQQSRGDYHVQLMHEWLVQQPISAPKVVAKPYHLLAHCTEKTALPATEKAWQQIFAKLGMDVHVKAVGCCGMAGTYGHEAQNQSNSRQLYDMSWQAMVQQSSPEQLLVTGFSCRSQVKRYEAFKPMHPLQALLQQLSRV